MSTGFKISLFEIGECDSCCYSWCCPCCAHGRAVEQLDDTPCWLGCCCIIGPITSRWLTRSSYSIPTQETCLDHNLTCFNCENCWDDCLKACFCPCCSINQVYQTTKSRGNVSTRGGRNFNTQPYLHKIVFENCNLRDCLCSTFCCCCIQADVLNQSVGMPWYLACCCVHPCAARHIYRYQNRLKGLTACDDYLCECCIPFVDSIAGNFMYGLTRILFQICYSVSTCQLIQEVRCRESSGIPYKLGYLQPQQT